jgi:hypothetical protein
MPVSEKVRHRLKIKSRKGVQLQQQAQHNKIKQELQKQAILGKEFGQLKIWHAGIQTNIFIFFTPISIVLHLFSTNPMLLAPSMMSATYGRVLKFVNLLPLVRGHLGLSYV